MPSPRLYYFVHWLFRVASKAVFKAEIIGAENFPKEGPFLLVCNHLSIFDIPLMFIASPRQMVMFSADKWQRVFGVREFCEMMGVIWVNRGEADMDAIRRSLGHLKSGGVLTVAAEGTRSRTHQLQKGKTGAAYLADRTNVPLLPVAVWGTEKVKHGLRRLRRTEVGCAIGQPFCLPPDGRAKGDQLEAFTDEIMCQIAALLPPDYRGVYADHPRLREILVNG
jgi:1-acyl-sn-glycerol-3-phosphate acyltransferase